LCEDDDGDGYGDYCGKGTDCDDSDASVNPSTDEVCNNVDDDCDGIADDGLSRECGFAGVGICTIGSERCAGGVWAGCTAVLPSEELCGNGLDDDCDGLEDESCGAQQLSKDELALTQFLDLKFGRGNYDAAYYIEARRKTAEFISLKKTSKAEGGRTRIALEISPIQKLYNVTVFEYIPKFIASSSDMIAFSVRPEIVQSDPLVAWHFAELTGKTDLSYEVDGEIEDAAAKTSTIAFAEDYSPLERPWYFDLLPLVLIPLMGLVFIVLVEFAHRRK
jgi:hypothetical protein